MANANKSLLRINVLIGDKEASFFTFNVSFVQSYLNVIQHSYLKRFCGYTLLHPTKKSGINIPKLLNKSN